ncbi:M23 family metallopeptidase [Evansella tamaricis]|uniref:M23 family metallopeptidase n=1 Tax=Evansella tamaricis TaxID=2069301 RepID=A0ABS6JBH9_9BACI|nr:M23 family metallopeptidase [Evansella tamaricis]MBU9710906.1 M23 family metallopeptidase [Evansella tamaricis]
MRPSQLFLSDSTMTGMLIFAGKKLMAVLIILLCFMIFYTWEVSANEEGIDNPYSIETVYHVFFGDERVGVVDDPNLIKEFEKDFIENYSKKYEGYILRLNKDLYLVPEIVFNDQSNNEDTLESLEKSSIISAESFELQVGEDFIGQINGKEDMEQLLKWITLEYISEEEFNQYRSLSETEEDLEELFVGDERILDISFSEEITWKESLADPDDILSIKEAFEIITNGVLEEEVYTVKEGDVLSSIASEHDLSMEEIKEINPEISENTLLQVGDQLKVTVLEPLTSVLVEKELKKEETIEYDTETIEDSDMWQGTSNVKQDGKEGIKEVHYTVTYENGRSVESKVVSENIKKEPINKIVVRGTKTSPSRGTGQLSWPAVGGYISSYMGNRWGRFHRGIDIARPSNFNILAADNGTIKSAGWENGYGNTIRINHNNGMETLYAHLERIDVSVGQTVGKGQVIGKMGTTGNSTGIHLHFEVTKDGELKNPMDYLNR